MRPFFEILFTMYKKLKTGGFNTDATGNPVLKKIFNVTKDELRT